MRQVELVAEMKVECGMGKTSEIETVREQKSTQNATTEMKAI